MTAPPFHAGDFVWCAFPESEHPARPSRHLHIGYGLAVTGSMPIYAISVPATPATEIAAAYQSVIAYTTSQPWLHAAGHPGVIPFSAEQAAAVGQQRPFVLHLWRVAHLPITPAWFPRLSTPGAGVVGRAALPLRRELEATAMKVFRRHAESIEQLGPPRPTKSKQ